MVAVKLEGRRERGEGRRGGTRCGGSEEKVREIDVDGWIAMGDKWRGGWDE